MGCIWSSDRIWANITVSFFTFSWCEATTQQELCHCYILNTGLIPLKCNAVYLFSVNDEIKQMKGTVHPKIKFRYFSSCLYIAAYPPRLFWVPSFVDTGLRYICLLSNIIKPDGTQLEALKAAQKKKIKNTFGKININTVDNPQNMWAVSCRNCNSICQATLCCWAEGNNR